MRILVIDDNSDSLHSLCMLLRDLGMNPWAPKIRSWPWTRRGTATTP